jgi:hypothetical protein
MRKVQLEYQRLLSATTPNRLARSVKFFGRLIVSALLPIWTVWYIGPWDATGESGSLWTVVRVIPHDIQTVGLPNFAANYCVSNVMTAGFFLLLGFGIERIFVFRARRRPAA